MSLPIPNIRVPDLFAALVELNAGLWDDAVDDLVRALRCGLIVNTAAGQDVSIALLAILEEAQDVPSQPDPNNEFLENPKLEDARNLSDLAWVLGDTAVWTHLRLRVGGRDMPCSELMVNRADFEMAWAKAGGREYLWPRLSPLPAGYSPGFAFEERIIPPAGLVVGVRREQETGAVPSSERSTAPAELLAMADGHDPGKQKTPMSAEAKPAAPASHDAAPSAATSKHSVNPFTSMDGLRWDEITITFIGLDSVRVGTRGRNETFTYDAMGFRHRTSHMAKPNECWKTFLHLAIVNTSNKTWNDVTRTPDLKKRISRLRTQLQEFFEIADNPITFRKGVGYQAAFNLMAEEHVIQATRERYTDCADEDEGDDIQGVMSEVPGKWSR